LLLGRHLTRISSGHWNWVTVARFAGIFGSLIGYIGVMLGVLYVLLGANGPLAVGGATGIGVAEAWIGIVRHLLRTRRRVEETPPRVAISAAARDAA
jgi:hypothetical protein